MAHRRSAAHRFAGATALVCAIAGAAQAAPIATLSADLDGDGAPDAIELDAGGVVHITGRPAGDVRLGAAVERGRIAVSHYRGQVYVVVEIAAAGARSDDPGREVVILRADAGAWRELLRVPVGGVGLDHEYGVEVDAAPDGIYRYQSRGDIRRCDGKPAYLFAEKFDGARFRRTSALPSNVPDSVPMLAARLDTARPAPPLLFQAHAASYEVGVGDAGGLTIPRELDDGRLDTMWREELAASAGEGQFFTFEPRAPDVRARQVRIVPGNPASPRSFNRPRRLAIVTPQSAWHVELPDAANEPPGAAYTVDLPATSAGCVTVVLESTYGPAQGTTAIAELEVFADGERSGGGDAVLAHLVAEGRDGATAAAATLARRGAAGAAAIDGELAATTDPDVRRRLIRGLAGIADPAAAPTLSHAATAGWVRDQDLRDVIAALGALGQAQVLHDLAASAAQPVSARAAAAAHLPVTGPGFALLVDLAGSGSRELRRAVIDRLSAAPIDALLTAAAAQPQPATAGDLWRAVTRAARQAPAQRGPALAAMLAALPAASDYERRYRLIDGIATLGDAAALATLEAALRALPATAETAALRQVAIHALGGAPRPEAARLVLAGVRDRDPGVRLAALAAVSDGDAAWAAPGGGDAARDGIDRAIAGASIDEDWPEVRRRAVTALGTRCQRPGPARALGDALDHDPDLAVRGDALSALVRCRAPGTAERLARIWDDGRLPTELRSRAVLEAVALGDPRVAAQLVERFTHWRGDAVASAASLELAQSAAAAIGRLAPPGAANALIDALEDTGFPELVQAAALGLGALGPLCPATARARLSEIARSGEPSAPAAKRAAAQCGR
jgi:HEAT repeat protein